MLYVQVIFSCLTVVVLYFFLFCFPKNYFTYSVMIIIYTYPFWLNRYRFFHILYNNIN